MKWIKKLFGKSSAYSSGYLEITVSLFPEQYARLDAVKDAFLAELEREFPGCQFLGFSQNSLMPMPYITRKNADDCYPGMVVMELCDAHIKICELISRHFNTNMSAAIAPAKHARLQSLDM